MPDTLYFASHGPFPRFKSQNFALANIQSLFERIALDGLAGFR
jgi:hypothetical protein